MRRLRLTHLPKVPGPPCAWAGVRLHVFITGWWDLRVQWIELPLWTVDCETVCAQAVGIFSHGRELITSIFSLASVSSRFGGSLSSNHLSCATDLNNCEPVLEQ